MEYSWFIWLAIYILVGWILYDFTDNSADYSTTIALCITWPLIFAGFVLVAAMLLIVGVIDLLLRSICNLWGKFNG